MPRVKSSTAKRKPATRAAKKDEDTLMEFEHFVSQSPASSGRGKGWLAITLIVLIIVLGAAWIFMTKTPQVQKDLKFKAVYLDNNQVYYAKVVKEDALSVYLDDVYYIQTEEQTIPAEEEGGDPQVVTVPILVKRGQELHQPQGWMQLNRDKVVAIEEIGPDSEIIKEINRQNSL